MRKSQLSQKSPSPSFSLFSTPHLAVDHLGQAVTFLLGQGLRVGLERRLHHRDRVGVAPGLGRLAGGLLGRPDERHLGVREASGGHGGVVEHVRAAAHVFDGGDALRRRGVREHVFSWSGFFVCVVIQERKERGRMVRKEEGGGEFVCASSRGREKSSRSSLFSLSLFRSFSFALL